jgi:uncharacterized membrane protein
LLVCAASDLLHGMQDSETWLVRWQAAGLLDDSTATAIRAFEESHAKPGGRRWQVLAALIFGAILLGAGVLLFVAAHWDGLSPLARMLLVLAMLVFFHGLGILTRSRFGGFATAMHGVGTLSAGAAIALVGQIFNMQEHWPSAVLLWALCAAFGWALLRDQFQQTLTMLLVPAWILSEWMDRANDYGGVDTYMARVLAVIGAVYLTGFLRSRRRAVFSILFAAGALLLPVSVIVLFRGWSVAGYGRQQGDFLPLSYRLAAIGLVLLAIAAAWFLDRKSWAPVLVVAAMAWALPWAQTSFVEKTAGRSWSHSEPGVLAYVLPAAVAVFLVWWGIHNLAKPIVNYGMATFALIVMWFYFESVMDKLDRSLGLIGLGILFLAGGWVLEYTRRRIVAGMETGVAA